MRAFVLALLGVLASVGQASADRYELQWNLRPLGALAQMRDEVADDTALAFAGGVALGVSYGVTNSLDVGLEALSLSVVSPSFSDAAVRTNGYTARGPYARRSDSLIGTVNATWRLGVIWVPVLGLGVGQGQRYRSAGVFTKYDFAPMETPGSEVKDWVVVGKVGIEHRLRPSWTLGAYTQTLFAWNDQISSFPAAVFSVGVSYVHYLDIK